MSSPRILRFKEMSTEIRQQIKQAKEKLLNDILSDKELSKLDKLKLISEEELFGYSGNIEEPFHEYYQEFEEKLKKQGIRNPTLDDYFIINGYERYQKIDLSSIAEYVDDNEGMVTNLSKFLFTNLLMQYMIGVLKIEK